MGKTYGHKDKSLPENAKVYQGQPLRWYLDDIADGRIPSQYLPRRDLSYITSLLNEKFKLKLSFQEVEELLHGIPQKAEDQKEEPVVPF